MKIRKGCQNGAPKISARDGKGGVEDESEVFLTQCCKTAHTGAAAPARVAVRVHHNRQARRPKGPHRLPAMVMALISRHQLELEPPAFYLPSTPHRYSPASHFLSFASVHGLLRTSPGSLIRAASKPLTLASASGQPSVILRNLDLPLQDRLAWQSY